MYNCHHLTQPFRLVDIEMVKKPLQHKTTSEKRPKILIVVVYIYTRRLEVDIRTYFHHRLYSHIIITVTVLSIIIYLSYNYNQSSSDVRYFK